MIWTETLGGSDIDLGDAIVGDAAGNVYLTGTFSGPVNFNPGRASRP